ncbi:asparaginase [Microbacterium halotolerans]|uniref:asparaginase n=1 Tax=Microbacterium halotolerans TaxID=246613 RepID=UPI000E6AA992|nr:asparaginase [Microbacterium halotolerans]
MPGTLSVDSSVELATADRGGFVESRHAGAAIVLTPEGEAALTLGDPDAVVLPRSAMKPFQAIACATAGAAFEDERLAISTASHAGTDRHVDLVRSMLLDAGLTEDHLGCPPALADDSSTRQEMIRDRAPMSRVRMTCSGKHAAMLAACAVNGWSTDSYLSPDHPLQQHIREAVERLCGGTKIAATVVDGCGAPVHAVALSSLARGMQRIGTSSETSPFALHRVSGALIRAVRENPWAVEGTGRPDTTAIEQFGVFSKFGAEGVQVMVAPDGTTVALKILDGSRRAGSVVALSLLAKTGALPADAVSGFLSAHPLYAVRGGDDEVGRIRPTV